MALLEVCCYGLESALTAQNAGADRIELCSAPNEGGLTPSAGCLRATRETISIPVHPIIRPRGGDFCYSDAEFRIMLNDIALVSELGFPGIVIGILDEDGDVDIGRMQQVMQQSSAMNVTFHRAFDMCRDPFYSIDKLADLGVARVLTSGQKASAEEGISLIGELNHYSCAPIIMAGAGVRPGNVGMFMQVGLKEVHSSAGRFEPSPMRYRKPGVSMSSDTQADEYSRYCVDADTVTKLKAIMTSLM